MTKRKKSFANLLKKRILVLDGAMGTMIQKYDLEVKSYEDTMLMSYVLDAGKNRHNMDTCLLYTSPSPRD